MKPVRALTVLLLFLPMVVGTSGASVAAGAPQDATPEPTAHQFGLVPTGGGGSDLAAVGDLQQEARRRAFASGQKSTFAAAAVGEFSALRERFTPPSKPDPGFVDECETTPAAGSQFGHIKNRIEWCATYIAFDFEFKLGDGGRIGFFYMPVTLIGYGRDDGVRNVVLFMKPQYVVFGGTYTPLSMVAFDVDCTHTTPGCGTVGDDIRLPVSQWLLHSQTNTWVSWQVTSDETVSTLQDLALFHPFNFEFKGKDGHEADSNDFFIRCDSATYFANRPKACIFHDVVPHLQYRIRNSDGSSTNIREVAEHIRQAFDDPDSTYPLNPERPKIIPGKYVGFDDGRYIERIPTDGPIYSANGVEKDRACQRRPPYEDTGLPTPPATPDEQCDEYPFASTRQGAAHPVWDFSVKAVTRGQNASAGNALVQFYRDDRILYSDHYPQGEWLDMFYVEIIPGGEGGGAGGGAPIIDHPPVVDAGPNMTGDEGSAVELRGSARDLFSTPEVTWSYVAGSGVDPGTTCAFSDPNAPITTFTCTDDGVFTVRLTATDGVNAPVSDTTTVELANIPPTITAVAPAAWSVFRVGQAVPVSASFTDAANDTHTCEIGWDDTTSDTFAAASHRCDRTHTYQQPGMYTVQLTVNDDDGGRATATNLLIVYDPDGGFATTGAYLESPVGALTTDPTVTGSLHVQLNPKYQPDNEGPVPSGGKVSAALASTGFSLDSVNLDWLVVTPGGRIAVKGTAASGYGFIAYAYDEPDRVRLVVWPLSTGDHPAGTIVYDNRAGNNYDLDLADPQPLSGGSVQVHV